MRKADRREKDPGDGSEKYQEMERKEEGDRLEREISGRLREEEKETERKKERSRQKREESV